MKPIHHLMAIKTRQLSRGRIPHAQPCLVNDGLPLVFACILGQTPGLCAAYLLYVRVRGSGDVRRKDSQR